MGAGHSRPRADSGRDSGGCRLDEYVLPAQRFRNPPFNTARKELRLRPSSSQALRQLVMRVVKRAGITAHVRPHDLRHAYAEHIARKADTRIAQHLLGTLTSGQPTHTWAARASMTWWWRCEE